MLLLTISPDGLDLRAVSLVVLASRLTNTTRNVSSSSWRLCVDDLDQWEIWDAEGMTDWCTRLLAHEIGVCTIRYTQRRHMAIMFHKRAYRQSALLT
jgi:hypothetical protein